MERVGLLNGENITYDKDITASVLASMSQGVIDGFGVSGSGAGAEILPGKALIKGVRTNGEEIMTYYESTENIAFDLSGTTYIFIELSQSKLDDGSSNNEDGTGIGEMKSDSVLPSSNYVLLYSVVSGSLTDSRQPIKGKLLRDGLDNWKLIYINGSGEEVLLSLGTSGFFLKSNGLNSIPSWDVISIDINNLTEKTEIKNEDTFVVYSAENTGNRKITYQNIASSSNIFLFGDGSDGNITISSNTDLTNDMYYNDLTINSGITLNTKSFRIFVKGTLTNNGTIANVGANGENGTDGTVETEGVGGNGGAVFSGGTLKSGLSGGKGGDGRGRDGEDISAINPGLGAKGGTGLDGTAHSGYTEGEAGTVGNVSYSRIPKDIINWINFNEFSCKNDSIIYYNGSGGGSGGGGQSSVLNNNDSGGGGGGGAPGGIIFILANIIINNGTITVKGGNGGNGGEGKGPGYGGGGGGGAGGVIFLGYKIMSTIGTRIVSGGTGGLRNTTPANSGENGNIYQMQII